MTKKIKCEKCNNEFSTKGGNYNKHIKVCDGSYKKFERSVCCKHCSLSFFNMNRSEIANHTRWCAKNPKQIYYLDKLDYCRSYITEDHRTEQGKSIKKAHQDGRYKDSAKKSAITRVKNGNHLHTEDTKRLIREKALASNHRRLKKCVVEYNGVLLDSSWELALAKRLDELEILWTRPAPIKWTDADGISHNYFPDFYLPDYDLYIDPKNPHAKHVQKSKLDVLLLQHKNILIIESLEECENFVLVGPP